MPGRFDQDVAMNVVTKSEGSGRLYAMMFWVLFGAIASVVGTAVAVSELFPHLSPKESCRIIWSIAIPLSVSTWVLGFFATRHPGICRWSIVGFVSLFIVLRIASYAVRLAS